jgi:hypothetical protein
MASRDLWLGRSVGVPPGIGLVDDGDAPEREGCLTRAGSCDFHRGRIEGWDACVALVTRIVDEQRDAGGAW